MSSEAALEVSPTALLEDFSLEMTGKDAGKLEQASATIPPGTRINVTFLGNEDLGMRLAAARVVREHGFIPVPHISARRLASREQLAEFLSALQAENASEHIFVVAGDPAEPQGPYPDAATILRYEKLQAHGVRRVSVAGYPEGHPQIPAGVLWTALADKASILRETRLGDSIITQFGFDASVVLSWVEQVRQRGITLPVRIGVPGPAGVRRLLSYASRFGVSTSKTIARKYGLSLTNLMSTAGPDKFLRELAAGYDAGRHGEIKLHFYTFGGLAATSEWISTFLEGS